VPAQNASVKNVPAHDRGSRIDPRAGQAPAAGQLVDVGKLVHAYYARHPDLAVPAQRVAFGTMQISGFLANGSARDEALKRRNRAMREALGRKPAPSREANDSQKPKVDEKPSRSLASSRFPCVLRSPLHHGL
jgi:hypothetical protein